MAPGELLRPAPQPLPPPVHAPAAATPAMLIEAVAPTIRRYLTGDL
jgi:hypothetical protein